MVPLTRFSMGSAPRAMGSTPGGSSGARPAATAWKTSRKPGTGMGAASGRQAPGGGGWGSGRGVSLGGARRLYPRAFSPPADLEVTVLSEFKAFLLKTNALALAVGVIIGTALGGVVNSLVNDII